MSVEHSPAQAGTQEASTEDSSSMDATGASSHTSNPRPSSLRWQILRRALLRHPPPQSDQHSEMGLKRISRKATQGFNLIPYHLHQQNQSDRSKDALLCFSLPVQGNPKLFLTQRVDNRADLNDFEICNRYDIDNTGLVCNWPSEEVLAYFCLSHADMFRSKRVIEIGSGYGLAGLVIAVATEASEVVISDGNPQVVDYIKHNIDANSSIFGGTNVEPMNLHWNQEEMSSISNTFDIIVASDCTFFKEFHGALARIIKLLLRNTKASEAIFFSPKRGDSLEKFLEEVKSTGLHFSITENYDAQVWKCHQKFMNGDDSWPSYEMDHCFPLLIRIML